MSCVVSVVQWAGTWQWSARPYRFSYHPAPEALPLDRVNRQGEGKPLALAMGQVTTDLLSELAAAGGAVPAPAASVGRTTTSLARVGRRSRGRNPFRPRP